MSLGMRTLTVMASRPNANNLVGASEIAERLGVGSSVVHDWARRYRDFPVPLAKLSMGNLWWWPEVQSWARSTGRAPKP